MNFVVGPFIVLHLLFCLVCNRFAEVMRAGCFNLLMPLLSCDYLCYVACSCCVVVWYVSVMVVFPYTLAFVTNHCFLCNTY